VVQKRNLYQSQRSANDDVTSPIYRTRSYIPCSFGVVRRCRRRQTPTLFFGVLPNPQADLPLSLWPSWCVPPYLNSEFDTNCCFTTYTVCKLPKIWQGGRCEGDETGPKRRTGVFYFSFVFSDTYFCFDVYSRHYTGCKLPKWWRGGYDGVVTKSGRDSRRVASWARATGKQTAKGPRDICRVFWA
jgi:hypothetical protein